MGDVEKWCMNELASKSSNGEGLRELALFAGAGGGILGGLLLGWRTVCAVEIEPYAAGVLAARQNDGILAPFPIWDDIRTFDGKPWRGIVDVVSGGFPCQDISAAGRGAGITGERSGLWKEMARIICEVEPRFVFVENSSMLTVRGLGTVLGDLAAMGFNAEWGVLSAADTGAPHLRERVWILANSHKNRCKRENVSLSIGQQDQTSFVFTRSSQVASNPSGIGLERAIHLGNGEKSHSNESRSKAFRGINAESWKSNHPEPGILGVDDGVAYWRDRIAATGNGQVPIVAATAWRILSGGYE